MLLINKTILCYFLDERCFRNLKRYSKRIKLIEKKTALNSMVHSFCFFTIVNFCFHIIYLIKNYIDKQTWLRKYYFFLFAKCMKFKAKLFKIIALQTNVFI